MRVETVYWLTCMLLATVGSIGLTAHEIAALLGLFVKKQWEVPFGTLVSLAELFGGVALAGIGRLLSGRSGSSPLLF